MTAIFKEVLTDVRLTHAIELIQQGCFDMTQLALRCGYQSASRLRPVTYLINIGYMAMPLWGFFGHSGCTYWRYEKRHRSILLVP